MANICTTNYVIEGEQKELDALYQTMKEQQENTLGCLVKALGKNPEEVEWCMKPLHFFAAFFEFSEKSFYICIKNSLIRMTNKLLHYRLMRISMVIALSLITTCAFSQTSPKVKMEKNRKIANGVVYSGPSVKEHIPTGNGRLTFLGQKKESIPDIIIVGSFDGNQIFDAAFYQGDTLRFWGNMTYKIQANESVTLTLNRGEIYDKDGNIRYWIDDKSPVILNNSASEKIAADLRGSGYVITYIDPLMSARYNLMANNGLANGQSYKLIVKGSKWTISSSNARFTWDEKYDFDTKDYTTCLNRPLHLIYENDYDISLDEDAFNRLIDVETPDTILYYTLLRMSQARPMIRKGFSYSYSQSEYPYYNIAAINDKDRVWLDNGAYTFNADNTLTKGCANFFGTPRQDYAEPHVVCIRKPEHEQLIKISRNTLTLVAKGTIQLACDHNRSDGSPKTPTVNKFSTSDCFWGFSRINKHTDLSEGTIHNVIIPFLGQEATWKVSSTTKIWATPRSTAGWTQTPTGYTRSKGDPYPPHRAVRTITQTLDLNKIAQQTGITIQELLVRLAATGVDGLINIHKGPLLTNVDSPHWTEIGLYAATWMAGGFTDPDKDFNTIITKYIPASYNKMKKDVWLAKHKGYSHVLDYCATQIESATSLSSLYNIFIELYPNVLPDGTDISNPKQLFYSALFFSSYSEGNDKNPDIANYRKRVKNKLVDLLGKETGDDMDEFLHAVQSFGSNTGAFRYADHPVPSVRRALRTGLLIRRFFDYPTLTNGIRLMNKYDKNPIMYEKLRKVVTQSCKITVSELKKAIERDIVCNDTALLNQDLTLLHIVIDTMQKHNYYNLNIDPEYFSNIENSKKNISIKNKMPAPENRETKYYIKQFFGITNDFTETAFGINMRMVYVEGGSFDMGCTGEQGLDCHEDESPTRYTTVDSFYIGMLEVTQSQWEKVMETTLVHQKNKAETNNEIRGQGSNCPMYFVNYDEAKEFCSRLNNMTGKNYRLPTEAEWEYAARGGSNNENTKYSGSNKVKNVAWYLLNSDEVHVCGTQQPNKLGIYDMSGNVYEWCGDWYGPYKYNDDNNPQGVASGSYRVIRGGGWSTTPSGCRVSNRAKIQPDERTNTIGFRVVIDQ